jgi:hypothetical protein
MNVGPVTGSKRPRQKSELDTPCEPKVKKARHHEARHHASETCATFPDLNTVEGQDAFFNMVGVEGIEQCFREDLKTVERVYWMKADEHMAAELALTVDAPEPRVRIDPSYFRDAKTRPVPGDGNCLMRSVFAAAEMSGSDVAARIPSSPAQMRKEVVAHVEREYAIWKDTPVNDIPDDKQFVAILPRDDRERHQEFARFKETGRWNEQIVDPAPSFIASTFEVRIEVITPYTDRNHRQVFGLDDPNLPLLVLRLEGAHYEAVVR